MKTFNEQLIENYLVEYYELQDCLVRRQVSFSGKRIDLVTRKRNGSKIWAIEIKISDWKTAIRQASLNMLAADYCFVALWYKTAGGALKNMEYFEKLGIGLFIINENFIPELKVRPGINNKINTIAYKNICEKL